jgi:outer membrane protein TolC
MKLFILLITLFYFRPQFALTLQYHEIPQQLLARNSAVKIANLIIAETKAKYSQSGRLPNPNLNFEFQNQSRLSPQSITLGFEQSFPITHRLKYEKKISFDLIRSAELEYHQKVITLIAEAQQYFTHSIAFTKQIELLEKQSNLTLELYSLIQSLANQGEISSIQLSPLKVEAQLYQHQKMEFAAKKIRYLYSLKSIFGLRPDQTLTLVGELLPPKLPRESSTQAAPAYQLSKNKIALSHAETSLTQANRWQDLSAGFFAGAEHQAYAGTQSQKSSFIGFRLSLPLPLWNNNKAKLEEKKLALQRSQLESKALELELLNEQQTHWSELKNHESIYQQIHETLLPLNKQYLDQVKLAYQQGQISLTELILSRQQQFQLEKSLIDTMREFNLSKILYEKICSTHFTSNLTSNE